MTITAAVDGSALGNPGPAGWAWVVSPDAWAAGGFDRATNNIGELMALVRLLEDTAAAGFEDEALVVLADSQYVINSVTKWMPGWKRRGWKKADGKPVMNRELLERIDIAMKGRDVRFEWVKGHAGHDLNEAADLRARAAAEAHKTGARVPTGPGFTETVGSRTALAAARGSVRAPSDEPIVAIAAAEATRRWADVLASARRDPVTITEPGKAPLLLLDADLAWQALALLDDGGDGGDGRLF